MLYKDYLRQAMLELAKFDDTIFIGQGVNGCGGTYMWNSFADLPQDKLIEMPVDEEFQMQMGIGLGLAGKFCISVYPRFNFLLLGLSGLVNVADKLYDITEKQAQSRMIVRVGVGARKKVYAGIQHSLDASYPIGELLSNYNVIELKEKEEIIPEYLRAYERGGKTVLVEYGDLYET